MERLYWAMPVMLIRRLQKGLFSKMMLLTCVLGMKIQSHGRVSEEGEDESDWCEQFLSGGNGEVGERGEYCKNEPGLQRDAQSTYLLS